MSRDPSGPMLALWREVIRTAMMDATSSGIKKGFATDWLLGDSAAFRYVCELADLNPDYVRRNAKTIISDGRTERLHNGWQVNSNRRNRIDNAEII